MNTAENDLHGKAVLITGGTMGIGLATGLAFGRLGAHCILTYGWGTADEAEVLDAFAKAGAPTPLIVQADVANAADTAALLSAVKQHHESIEAFISNVSVALVVKDLDEYSARALHKSIDYSAWPIVDYTRRIRDMFGRYPRYVIGLSSGGPEAFFRNYDFVAASKSVMETLCRYMSYRLFDDDVHINVVRARMVQTESLRATVGEEFVSFAEQFKLRGQFVNRDDVANTIVALCSGLLDGVRGQVITVDRGAAFFDNLMRLYQERDAFDVGVHSNLE